MPLSDFLFVQLAEGSDLSAFDCNDADINGFLKDDALNYQKDNMANTYLFLNDKQEIVAFFSISNDCLNDLGEVEVENRIWNKFHKKAKIPNIKRIRSYPSIKIGRLGVCINQHSTGLAYELMDFIKGFSILELKPACRLLLLDAYNKDRQIKYYQKNGFDFLKDDDANLDKRVMFYSLNKILPTI